MVYDPLRKSHGAFDKAVKDAAGDVQKLKDAIKLYPKKVKSKNSGKGPAPAYLWQRIT